MNTENLLTAGKKEELAGLLSQQKYEEFFTRLKPLGNSELLESSVQDILEEWRKLQIAKKNGLMDDEQIHLAFTAYFRRTASRMIGLSETS